MASHPAGIKKSHNSNNALRNSETADSHVTSRNSDLTLYMVQLYGESQCLLPLSRALQNHPRHEFWIALVCGRMDHSKA